MKSLLSIQNQRRNSERRQDGNERRSLQDRRVKSVPVAEERRKKERRILEERRMNDFQKNIIQKDVLEKEEYALIISRGLDEDE